MTTTALTSELEAINTLLASIGESPISSLEVTGLADVASARSMLDEISREIQTIGWQFNVEDEFPLARDSSNRILLPPTALKVVPSAASGLDLAQRGLKLYDKTNHKDTFEKDLTARITFLLPWEELPQVARHYIMVRASRIFQARTLGSDTQYRFSEDEETDARAALDETEGATGNYNMFQGNSSVLAIMER